MKTTTSGLYFQIYRAVLLVVMISLASCQAVENETNKTDGASMEHQHTNHLIDENSPYLLSHAHNPVDWYPWGPEALEKAKTEDKPIFLSIGYAACHWCHVMERESFENEEIARILNESFVSIKVDREQRPDLDEIYMTFTTAMTGSGGWPMSVFLTSDLKPFFAGTYFPPVDGYGRPGFMGLITEIAGAYQTKRDQIISSSELLFNQLSTRLNMRTASADLKPEFIRSAAKAVHGTVDHTHGGFGSAPKFPHALEISLLLRQYHQTKEARLLDAAEISLKSMARGGIYDQVAGGFARYSTDREWLVPHFEKMLYDNALLVPVYADAYLLTGDELYLSVVSHTLDFVLREMTDTTGGFYSALDADSEGEEGKFYVWIAQEIDDLLGEDAELFKQYYGVTDKGNFEGKNILHVSSASDKLRESMSSDKLDAILIRGTESLLEARTKRVRPLTDDKLLSSWNGLMLTALCRGYQITGKERYLRAAQKNADFIRSELFQNDRLTHSYRKGRHSHGEFLEDYSFLTRGLLDLYQTDHGTNNVRWLIFATKLTSQAASLFMDSTGHFYLRPEGQTDLILRPQEEGDGAIPSAGSLMINNLLVLNRLTGDQEFFEPALKGLEALSGRLANSGGGMTSAILALDYYFQDKIEVVVVGNSDLRKGMLTETWRRYLPNSIVVSAEGEQDGPASALFKERNADHGQALAFVCVNSTCKLPASTVDDLKHQLSEL